MGKIRIPNYSLGEELINSISHGLGALLSIAGLVILLVNSHSAMAAVTSSIYGSTMIVLYVISCIYHGLSKRTRAKGVLRVIDHCNVYLLVAGTFTPITLSLIGGVIGWVWFAIVWIITIIGIVLTSIDVDKYSFASVVLHLALGWSCLICYKPLFGAMDGTEILFLVLGGVFYSIGAALYGIGKKKKYMHSVFHFFVLAGSIFHFFMILHFTA